MDIVDRSDFNVGLITEHLNEVLCELEDIFKSLSASFDTSSMDEIRKEISKSAVMKGWALDFTLPKSNLKITMYKNQIGVCIQFGNICRTYGDLLKIQKLLHSQIISLGVLCLPLESRTKKNSTYASYEKLCKDIDTFLEILPGPMVCFGLG